MKKIKINSCADNVESRRDRVCGGRLSYRRSGPAGLTTLCCLLFADVRPGRTYPRKRSVPVCESYGQRKTASGRRVHHQSDHSRRERQLAGFRQSGEYIIRMK